jgi:hypothetical protein
MLCVCFLFCVVVREFLLSMRETLGLSLSRVFSVFFFLLVKKKKLYTQQQHKSKIIFKLRRVINKNN